MFLYRNHTHKTSHFLTKKKIIYIYIYNIYILPETLVILEMELDIIDSREILVFYLRTRIRF